MTAAEENLVLLFWSGELEPAESRQAETLIANNDDAARLLADLKRQAELARSETAENAVPRSFASAAAEVVANEKPDRKVIQFPRFQIIVTIAAAVAVLAIALFFLNQPEPAGDPGLATDPGRREALDLEISDLEASLADFQQTAGFSRRRT
ncbi:MAG: anti-sigma factor RsiW [Verrucomicrobiales bacterium]|jgi:anti-sigma factor RsiW